MFGVFNRRTTLLHLRNHSALETEFHMVEPIAVVALAPLAEASRARILRVYSPNFTELIIYMVRGRGNSLLMVSNKRPGRADITKTKSERNTAS